MNDEQRAELIEELAEAMYDYERMSEIVHVETWERFCEKVGDSNDYKYYASNCLPIIERLLADRAATVVEPDAETVERVAKEITSIWNKPSPNPTAFPASAETLARAAIAAMPHGDPDWQVELRSLYFHQRQEVYREMQWNDRYAVRGDLRVMWPDALLGIEGTEVLAAIAKAKEGAG